MYCIVCAVTYFFVALWLLISVCLTSFVLPAKCRIKLHIHLRKCIFGAFEESSTVAKIALVLLENCSQCSTREKVLSLFYSLNLYLCSLNLTIIERYAVRLAVCRYNNSSSSDAQSYPIAPLPPSGTAAPFRFNSWCHPWKKCLLFINEHLTISYKMSLFILKFN